ncbi:MAG TPA: hypothetical protein VD794_08650 [Flavisolibacter sp.]|nr:hypothetical protein [Flavisolibacter sp.]
MSTTSFHINGFWAHVTWDAQGKVGRDQHGHIWYNKENPRSEMGGLRPTVDRFSRQPATTSRLAGFKPASNKDYFLQQRESAHEYYHTRSAMMK